MDQKSEYKPSTEIKDERMLTILKQKLVDPKFKLEDLIDDKELYSYLVKNYDSQIDGVYKIDDLSIQNLKNKMRDFLGRNGFDNSSLKNNYALNLNESAVNIRGSQFSDNNASDITLLIEEGKLIIPTKNPNSQKEVFSKQELQIFSLEGTVINTNYLRNILLKCGINSTLDNNLITDLNFPEDYKVTVDGYNYNSKNLSLKDEKPYNRAMFNNIDTKGNISFLLISDDGTEKKITCNKF